MDSTSIEVIVARAEISANELCTVRLAEFK